MSLSIFRWCSPVLFFITFTLLIPQTSPPPPTTPPGMCTRNVLPWTLLGSAAALTAGLYAKRLVAQLRLESLIAELAPPGDDPFRPIVILGPSGVGKSTLIKGFSALYPGAFGFSCSTTTRAIRPSETAGVHYHFSTLEKFQQAVKAGKFIEHAQYAGNWYGTSIEELRKIRREKQGVLQVKKSIIKPFYVFLYTDIGELRRRLEGRGDTSEADMQKRLNTAEKELKYLDEEGMWDLKIESTTIEDTLNTFLDWLHAHYPHLNDDVSASSS